MNQISVETSGARPLPLGTQVENGRIRVSFASGKRGTARLHLYKKGREKEEAVFVFPEENRMGDIRYMALSGFDPAEYEYSLSVDECPIEDIYAGLVTGREKWGEGSGRLRYGFVSDSFDWGEDRHPGYSFEDTIIYRLHVRGFTKHPSSGVKHKGTFAGIGEKIPYLKALGITMVELMLPDEFSEIPAAPEGSHVIGVPGQTEAHDCGSVCGRLNYWGYGPAYCFAPKASYCVGGGREKAPDIQLRELVKALHENGLEAAVELYFEPDMGTAFQLACLRHWVEEYHVDGIHVSGNFDSTAAAGDPALTGIKLFAGNFAAETGGGSRHLADYRDDFQVDMRRFLKGDEDMLHGVVYQLRENGGRRGKVNFMANTNGFTMLDMVSYDRKHNETNGENGKDGSDYNYSWNCGVEGPVRKKRIIELRKRQLRNAWVLLMTAQGMPLILAGDELGNSQDGNNNTYCQDNPTGWVNWKKNQMGEDIFRFASHMIRFRKEHPMLHREGGLRGMDDRGVGCPDFSVHGESPWFPQYEAYRRQLGLLYNGKFAEDEDLYVIFNMHWEPHLFSLPHTDGVWKLAIDTAREDKNGFFEEPELLEDQKVLELKPRSIVVLVSGEEGGRDEILQTERI